MRIRLPRIDLVRLVTALPMVVQAVDYVVGIFKGKRQPVPQDDNKKESRVMEEQILGVSKTEFQALSPAAKLSALKTKLQSAPSKSNVVILWLIGQIDYVLILIAGQAPESAEELVRDIAKTIQIWIKYAIRYAEKTATPIDDAFFNELAEAAAQLSA